jgi:hypothetical protein
MLRRIIPLWSKWDSGFPSPLRTLALIIVATLVAYGFVIAGLYAGYLVTRRFH